MTDESDPQTSDLLMRLKGEIEGLKLWTHVLIATHPNVGAAKALMEQMQGGVVVDGTIGAGFSDTVRGLMETAERVSAQGEQ
jgi:hypothetical protein